MGNDFSGNHPDPLVLELINSSSRISDYRDGFVSNGLSNRSLGTPPPSLLASSYLAESMGVRMYSGAAPLSPLRTRDLAVLEDWFQPEYMPEIEADIIYNLLLRFPEPCWEDHVFGFLGEFL